MRRCRKFRRGARAGLQMTMRTNTFRPFQLAIETQNARLVSAASDRIQKLMAYGYSTGKMKVSSERKEELLMDVIIRTICSCSDHSDENVQLQVIKALLTGVSCNHCEVHATSLLLAVRACYHIHLVSRNSVNRTTAKGSLKQMLNIVFQKMEAFDKKQGKEAKKKRRKRRTRRTRKEASREGRRKGSGEMRERMWKNNAEFQDSRARGRTKHVPGRISLRYSTPVYGHHGQGSLRCLPCATEEETRRRRGRRRRRSFRIKAAQRCIFIIFRALCKLSMKESAPSEAGDASADSREQTPSRCTANFSLWSSSLASWKTLARAFARAKSSSTPYGIISVTAHSQHLLAQ